MAASSDLDMRRHSLFIQSVLLQLQRRLLRAVSLSTVITAVAHHARRETTVIRKKRPTAAQTQSSASVNAVS